MYLAIEATKFATIHGYEDGKVANENEKLLSHIYEDTRMKKWMDYSVRRPYCKLRESPIARKR